MGYFKTALDNLNPAIRSHRTSSATVTILHNGVPLTNQDVVVQQQNHQFLFGANWGSSIALANGELSGPEKEAAERYQEQFNRLFNLVTMPFYWAQFEAKQGQPATERILNAARWHRDRGSVVKGHPLCWHTLTADWLLEMSDEEILQTQIARIERDVTAFAGVIDIWDVINEVVIMPIFDRYDNGITRICKALGRINLIRTVFETARAKNPGAVLILNDFDVSPAYDILVEGCLEAGIQIDVIGIQSHMHQGYWGVDRTLSILERFERFNLPIHFTETTLISGELMPPEIVDLNDYQVQSWPSTPDGEARQAEETALHYKTLFAHPLVQAITWWDMTDGAWLNAPAGLLRKDLSRKPAYDELLHLIKGDWWVAPTKMTTDSNGQISFTGSLGTYELQLADQRKPFALDCKGQTDIMVSV